MKKIIRQEFPWFLAHALWFWCIPMLYSGIESAMEVAYLMLLVGNPIFCMIVSLLYGMKYGRKWGFLVYPVVAWIPSMLMYYNSTALVFGVIAWFCAAVGLIIGGWMRNRRLSSRERWEEAHDPALQEKKPAQAVSSGTAAPRVASKTAAKNQQKAAARKAKERAEKEQKLREKNQPKPTKKKRR